MNDALSDTLTENTLAFPDAEAYVNMLTAFYGKQSVYGQVIVDKEAKTVQIIFGNNQVGGGAVPLGEITLTEAQANLIGITFASAQQ